jgi:glucan phosphoethanolaminetransferase (alkaline phosphatase superfamily)
MVTLQAIFASGWIQITILVAIFVGFSRWALSNQIRSGYGIGWLVGIFFIVAFGALFPRSTLQVAAAESTQLSFLGVMMSAIIGFVIAIVIVGITLALKGAWFRQIFAVSGITSVLITMLFVMIISSPQTKMALTLSSLSFAIVMVSTYVIRRAYMRENRTSSNSPIPSQDAPPQSARLERIRDEYAQANR